jgi:hypothetical protein
MVIVKASPHVDLRARLTPQRPPRQLDVFPLTYHAVDKNEVPHLDENGFDTQFPHHAAVIEQGHVRSEMRPQMSSYPGSLHGFAQRDMKPEQSRKIGGRTQNEGPLPPAAVEAREGEVETVAPASQALSMMKLARLIRRRAPERLASVV